MKIEKGMLNFDFQEDFQFVDFVIKKNGSGIMCLEFHIDDKTLRIIEQSCNWFYSSPTYKNGERVLLSTSEGDENV